MSFFGQGVFTMPILVFTMPIHAFTMPIRAFTMGRNPQLAISHLSGGWRDALFLQSQTGWHVTEIRRFATD